jgi:hypothetical protein
MYQNAMEEGWRQVVDGQWLRDCMEEWRDWGNLTLRAKWTMDGATTLAEAAARFRERAEGLDELARAGFELDQPVNDDYAILVRPGEESPMRLVEEDE